MKNYISIHFANHNAVNLIAANNPKIKANVGCVNIPDKADFPLEDIKRAIDYCFNT